MCSIQLPVRPHGGSPAAAYGQVWSHKQSHSPEAKSPGEAGGLRLRKDGSDKSIYFLVSVTMTFVVSPSRVIINDTSESALLKLTVIMSPKLFSSPAL